MLAVMPRLLDAARAALEMGEGAGELFPRGIFPHPAAFLRQADDPIDTKVFWEGCVPASGRMSGHIFADGSAV